MARRLRTSTPQLFGQDTRSRVLASLAVDGLAHKRGLAKRLKIGYSSIHVVLKHFTQMGVIAVGRGYAAPITLAPWFAAPELEALLCKIESWPCPKNTARNGVVPYNIIASLEDEPGAGSSCCSHASDR